MEGGSHDCGGITCKTGDGRMKAPRMQGHGVRGPGKGPAVRQPRPEGRSHAGHQGKVAFKKARGRG